MEQHGINASFGVVEAPRDLVLREGETIEWYILYEVPPTRAINSFIIHANTSDRAEKAFKDMKPSARIKKIEYLGTYQY